MLQHLSQSCELETIRLMFKGLKQLGDRRLITPRSISKIVLSHFAEIVSSAVSTISIKLPRTWRALVLCSIWTFCYYGFLLVNGQQQVVVTDFHPKIWCSKWGVTNMFLFDSGVSYLPLTGTVLCTSLLVGFTTSLILFCSHFHQVLSNWARFCWRSWDHWLRLTCSHFIF